MAAVLSLLCGTAVIGGAVLLAPAEKMSAAAEDTLLYSQDFESLSASSAADEIYGATSVAGATRSIEETQTRTCIEAPYTFHDNGYQQTMLYLDTNRGGIGATDVSATYTYTMEFQLYGLISSAVLMIQGPDTAAYNSVITFYPDGRAAASNYAEQFVTLVSASMDEDGWWTVEYTAGGTGGYMTHQWSVVTTDYATANAQKNTGIRVSDMEIRTGETAVYSLSDVTPGLSGNDAVYGETGFAGIADMTTKALTDNRLKAVYSFWPTAEGGWQGFDGGIYFNENALNIATETGKQYVVEFELTPFGRVAQTVCIFEQTGVTGQNPQILLKADGTYEILDNNTNTIESGTVVYEDGTFKVTAVLNGVGGLLKPAFNMQSSDADGANETKDTGLYLDDIRIFSREAEEPDPGPDPDEPMPDTDVEYRPVFAENFDNTDPTTSGSDPMFHATGFAGGANFIGVAANGIGDSQCLRTVYVFYEDGGWQNGNIYLDSTRTSGTARDTAYRFTMKIKPFGSWDTLSVGFQAPDNTSEFVYLYADGTFETDKAESGNLIDAQVTYADGVFDVTAYVRGTGGFIFNYFHMKSSDPAAANANLDTGFYLDDYEFARGLKESAGGFDKLSSMYNKATGGDFVSQLTFEDVAAVTLDDTALTSEQYSFADGFLTVKESALSGLDEGTYTLTARDGAGETASAEIMVVNAAMGTVYTMDFSAMPDLNGDAAANDTFFQNSYMDPAYHKLYTVDEDGNRAVRFVNPDGVSEMYRDMFQFNPQGERLSMLGKDRWHTIAMDWKPENGTTIGIRGNVFENGNNTQIFYMEIDLVNGVRTDDGEQSAYVTWNVTEKGDGWYTLSVSFFYTGDSFGSAAAGYIVLSSAKEAENTAWTLDNIVVESELFPVYVSGSGDYDLASGTTPYYLIDLNRTFDILSVTMGNATLAEGTDYTLSTTPVGYTRMDLTETFCKNYALGEEDTVVVRTSKGNALEMPFRVIDTSPRLPAQPVSFDKAAGTDLVIDVDLAGQTLAGVSVGGTLLENNEFALNAQGDLVAKYSYLSTLEEGSYTFALTTSSGAGGSFTVVVSDTTPVISGTLEYDKSIGGDFTVTAELNGKDLVSVSFGGRVLAESEYTYADGTLTIKASVFAELYAGNYALVVTTIASAEVQIAVVDAPPVITGEYTAKAGEPLVIDVDLKGREILSVTVEGLLLKAEEYSYADGKLTVSGGIFAEIAAGERSLVLVTTGGSAELVFTLEATSAPSGSESTGGGQTIAGCGSALAGIPLAGLALAVALLKKRK